MKTAVLVVSFGTTHLDTLEKTICRVEEELASSFPDSAFFRAFTSSIVRRRLKDKYSINADSIEEALTKISAEGIKKVFIQPTHLVPGHEYDKLCCEAKAAGKGMDIIIGRPLLCGNEDLEELADVLKEEYPAENGEILIAMGHGTDHDSGRLYERLAGIMEERGMLLTTVEGKPDFNDTLSSLGKKNFKKAHLVPLLLVAGDHTKNDMAGEKDSLRSLLCDAGYDVRCTIKGLGEIKSVRNMYVRRLSELMNEEGECR